MRARLVGLPQRCGSVRERPGSGTFGLSFVITFHAAFRQNDGHGDHAFVKILRLPISHPTFRLILNNQASGRAVSPSGDKSPRIHLSSTTGTIVFAPGRSDNPTPICMGDVSSLWKVLSTRLKLEPASMLIRFVSLIFRPPASTCRKSIQIPADRAARDDVLSAPVFRNVKLSVLPNAKPAATARFADAIIVLRRPVRDK